MTLKERLKNKYATKEEFLKDLNINAGKLTPTAIKARDSAKPPKAEPAKAEPAKAKGKK